MIFLENMIVSWSRTSLLYRNVELWYSVQ